MAIIYNVEAKVEGRQALIANLYATQKAIVRRMQRATRRAGEDTRQLAFQLAPKDTWFMANHIRVEFTPELRGYDVFLDPEDFAAEGLPFYPPFVELGTSISGAQPFLRPAFEIMQAHYQADISKAIRAALQERNRGI